MFFLKNKLQSPLMFVGAFALLCILGEYANSKIKFLWSQNHLRPAVVSVTLPQSDEYPAFFGTSNNHHTLDHYVLFHNLDGWVEHAKKADVIFTGNSRVLYAFDQTYLETLTKKDGLSFYNLGFQCAEGMGFSYEIIKKFNLQPKMIVVNGDEFFPRYPTEFAKNVMRKTRFEAWKSVFENKMYFYYMLTVHRFLPYWENIIHPGAILIYRSTSTGWWTFGFPNAEITQQVVYGQDAVHPEPVRDFAMENARRYKALLDERGIELVITWIPKPALGNVTEVRLIAQELGVPYLPIDDLTDIYTFDHSHLDAESAEVFSSRLFDEIKKSGVYEKIVRRSRIEK
jgi:hypothetical protein